ncbi:MAG: methyltransferase, TrmH family [Actinomycetota bacterium]|nr:methyltransferase, TrmH family [Actinomycetota bacterium]
MTYTGSPGELTDPRAATIKAARRLLKRSFREHDRAFLAEGAQAVREALAEAAKTDGPRIRQLFLTGEARGKHADLAAQAVELGIPVQQASGHVMAQLSDTVTPQGLVAVCDLLDVSLETVLAQSAPPHLVVVLAAVRDPGNAGTVLRTCDAAGADAVVFSDTSVDPYNGKCVRASAGSLFHLPVVVGASMPDTIAALRAAGLQILAADGSASADLDELERAGTLGRPSAWIFGNEAWGLPTDLLESADVAVRVPIHGRAESLNLAAAAAVCLYASARAFRSPR